MNLQEREAAAAAQAEEVAELRASTAGTHAGSGVVSIRVHAQGHTHTQLCAYDKFAVHFLVGKQHAAPLTKIHTFIKKLCFITHVLV